MTGVYCAYGILEADKPKNPIEPEQRFCYNGILFPLALVAINIQFKKVH